MPTLSELLLTQEKRPQVLKDCVALLEHEVDGKSGLSGFAIKSGFKVLKAVKPGMVEDTMDGLLNEFVEKLEPVHAEYVSGPRKQGLEQYLTSNSARIANTLLGITDERARHSKHNLVKNTYEKLRPTASRHIEEALPAVARLLRKHDSSL